MEGEDKGSVCVTGGTGYVASWLIMRLLQRGYKVHTTIRSYPGDTKKDISFLTNLPGAPENLQIFQADLDHPVSFTPAIEGCSGVFHVAHPMNYDDEESEQVKHKRAINGTLEILKACLQSKTVKRVVYTSSGSAVGYHKGSSIVDESMWSDTEFIQSLMPVGASYYVGKTLTESAVLEFGEKHGLDVVSVIPAYIHGPFISPHVPDSVSISLAMIMGDKDKYQLIVKVPMVHIDDVANAHIFLLEHPEARGRYICSAADITIEKMSEFLSARYPQYQIPAADCLKEVEGYSYPDFSSKKLLDIGFEYKYGLEDMYDGAIQCCKEKGFL